MKLHQSFWGWEGGRNSFQGHEVLFLDLAHTCLAVVQYILYILEAELKRGLRGIRTLSGMVGRSERNCIYPPFLLDLFLNSFRRKLAAEIEKSSEQLLCRCSQQG